MPNHPKQTRPAKQADLAEIELLKQKVTDLVTQKPQQAAQILELWLKAAAHSPRRQKLGGKKAA